MIKGRKNNFGTDFTYEDRLKRLDELVERSGDSFIITDKNMEELIIELELTGMHIVKFPTSPFKLSTTVIVDVDGYYQSLLIYRKWDNENSPHWKMFKSVTEPQKIITRYLDLSKRIID